MCPFLISAINNVSVIRNFDQYDQLQGNGKKSEFDMYNLSLDHLFMLSESDILKQDNFYHVNIHRDLSIIQELSHCMHASLEHPENETEINTFINDNNIDNLKYGRC